MNEPAKIRIEAEFDPETYDLLHDLAEAAGQTDAAFVAEVVRRFSLSEADFLASIEEAEREIEAGHFYSQEQMERWYEERVAAGRNG
ncbi:hypothetical protein [Sphingomonas sp. Y38-1Y]|uniref:hypothetical protein n=1 Tax=Sphingomonas sp. Y38-1Y TaxID=3078265 RepID=UPI0028EBD47B|nr:hypothetical protein [Sphingomonas sp. Y38-1Y]